MDVLAGDCRIWRRDVMSWAVGWGWRDVLLAGGDGVAGSKKALAYGVDKGLLQRHRLGI